ncbi:MAG: hypothetical protein KAH21_11455 [Spirochaetaceae bacterium]|nr:hypothetical protein [Spirochaetaceae bacterium]
MVSPILFIVVPLAAAFLTVLVNRNAGAKILALLTTLVLTALAWFYFRSDLSSPISVVIAGIASPLGIQLSMDRLSAALALLISVSGLLIIIYSQSYLKSNESQSKHYAVLMLLLASSFGILLTRDLFNLFVFYEILCISSYILVASEETKASFEASLKYLLLGSVGSLFMLIAIGLAYRVSGSLAMSDIARALGNADSSYTMLTAALFVLGMGIEAAIFPVNTWLPDAHSSAPSSISAVLSGFVIELALIVLLRISMTVFSSVNLMLPMRYMALAGIFIGELAAFGQTELKRTLAYSSMGQVGIMLFALTLGTEAGRAAGMAHLVMHTGAKSVLFLIAGYFILRTGKRDIESYKGLGRRMPLTGVFFVIAALSLVGVPPLFGFFTKFKVLSAAAASGAGGAWLGVSVILLGTVLEASYLFRVVRTLYSVPEDGSEKSVKGRIEMDTPALAAVFGFTLLVIFGSFLLPLIPSGMAL